MRGMIHPERLKVLPAYYRWKHAAHERAVRQARIEADTRLWQEEVRQQTERLKYKKPAVYGVWRG